MGWKVEIALAAKWYANLEDAEKDWNTRADASQPNKSQCEYIQGEYGITSTSCGESTVAFCWWNFCPWCGKKILITKVWNNRTGRMEDV